MTRTGFRMAAAIGCAAALVAPVRAGAEAPTLAVSLAALQSRVAGPPSPERDLALSLGGLTRVDGFVVDEGGGDLVLFGVADDRAPGLRTEDFVVALRSAFRIAVDEGWTSLAFPAISSGIFAVPPEACARAYLRAADEFFLAFRRTSLKTLRLVVFEGPVADAMRRMLPR